MPPFLPLNLPAEVPYENARVKPLVLARVDAEHIDSLIRRSWKYNPGSGRVSCSVSGGASLREVSFERGYSAVQWVNLEHLLFPKLFPDPKAFAHRLNGDPLDFRLVNLSATPTAQLPVPAGTCVFGLPEYAETMKRVLDNLPYFNAERLSHRRLISIAQAGEALRHIYAILDNERRKPRPYPWTIAMLKSSAQTNVFKWGPNGPNITDSRWSQFIRGTYSFVPGFSYKALAALLPSSLFAPAKEGEVGNAGHAAKREKADGLA